jgi:acetyl-CoA carboxylase beta subunit
MSENVTHSAENTTNPAENTTNPAGNVTNPVGNVTNPAENVTHPGKCPRCERTISKKHIKKHIEICKGVPKNTCGVCFRIFTTQQAHSRHQKNCKKKKEIHVTNSEEQMDMLLERLQKGNDERLQVLQTELKKDYEQKIRLLQFRYDNDRAMMQELFN